MGTTEKISITIGHAELRSARTQASRLGLSLSVFINGAVRERLAEETRRDAARELLASFAPDERASPEEQTILLASWANPETRPKRQPGRRGPGRVRTSRDPCG